MTRDERPFFVTILAQMYNKLRLLRLSRRTLGHSIYQDSGRTVATVLYGPQVYVVVLKLIKGQTCVIYETLSCHVVLNRSV